MLRPHLLNGYGTRGTSGTRLEACCLRRHRLTAKLSLQQLDCLRVLLPYKPDGG